MHVWKLILLSGLLIAFLGLASSQEEELDIDSDRIDSIRPVDADSANFSVKALNESSYVGLEGTGVAVYEAVEINFSEPSRIEVAIKEDQEWATDFIRNNPSYFDGPGHNYSPGLWGVVKEEDFSHSSLTHSDSLLVAEISESGKYYFIFEGTNSSRENFVGPDGDCDSLLSSPGPEYQQVDNCETGAGYIQILGLVVFSLTGLLLSWKIYRFGRRKLLLRNINSKVEKLESDPDVSREQFEELYDAMDMAVEGEYDEASKVLDKLD